MQPLCPANAQMLGELVVPCAALDANLRFFTEELGMQLLMIFPAEAPHTAVVAGHGLRLRLTVGTPLAGLHLHLLCDQVPERPVRIAPNGTEIHLRPRVAPVPDPPLKPSFSWVAGREAGDGSHGRAGMRYHDLIPDRQGGWVAAARICIPDGGPVPDYVHYHRVHFQMIYCLRGHVRVVYEDQGAPFLLHAGMSVLQPPTIRHRVLEASPGLEVLELGCPAVHETLTDPGLALPTDRLCPERLFGGSRFLHSVPEHYADQPWRLPGLVARELGYADATDGRARVHRVTAPHPTETATLPADPAWRFLYCLQGGMSLVQDAETRHLSTDGCATLPPDASVGLAITHPHTAFLEVCLPAAWTDPG